MKRTLLTLTMVLASSVCSQSFGFDLLDKMLGMKGCGSSAGCCSTGCDVPCAEPACGVEAPCGVCAAEPACGVEAPCGVCAAEPACGVEAPCGCTEPTCGCEAPYAVVAQPTCAAPSLCNSGCDSACGKQGGCGLLGNGCGLLSKLFGKNHGSSCDSACGFAAQPNCGCEVPCEMPCDTGCDSHCGGNKCGGLLSKLFGNLHKKQSCCDSACDMGCNTGCGCATPGIMGAPTMQTAPGADATSMPPAPVVDPSASYSAKRRVIQASASYVR